MSNPPEFDLENAHRYFSAECFNQAWDYIDRPQRTPADDEQMLALSYASFWHWRQRPDRTSGNLSIGYWQLSRVHALLGQADLARQYGQRCLEASREEGTQPFHLGYAYEALARAERVAGKTEKARDYLELARQVGEKMDDPEVKKQLLADLATIA